MLVIMIVLNTLKQALLDMFSLCSMLGTVMVGMTCEDIALLETNDIFRLADVMMKQTGWNLRQVFVISDYET